MVQRPLGGNAHPSKNLEFSGIFQQLRMGELGFLGFFFGLMGKFVPHPTNESIFYGCPEHEYKTYEFNGMGEHANQNKSKPQPHLCFLGNLLIPPTGGAPFWV